ncbi:filamentous hemagglutinin N-terminal domain-containing protein [Candidatus Magnetaquicoccus inordinatus]|uniref:two-partner secretion domain-containing protein n=1 Tax=Candidatus Magnetaquicoccus inordinatus TaxID=2496818 RepID=UPI00187D2AF6|nr:filamentous hemagglutinin N-terminal domain-containing protein [Candidatus Magnetaquicoccus inordinatus]
MHSTPHSPRGKMLVLAALVAGWTPLLQAGAPAATALPTGGQVIAGQGAINQAGAAMTVTQNSPSMIANWQSFNIGQSASVTFVQPSAHSVVLNQVLSANPSQIYGKMSANGQVFLVNPNGVYFGASARVDVGGLVASSLNLSNADFLAGNYSFSGGVGAVSNLGELAAREGGFVSLVGGSVDNAGVIRAEGGQVAMAAGKEARLNLTPNGLIGVKVDTAGEGAKVNNSGLVIADGGKVWMTAKSAAPALAAAVNQSGVVRANTLANKNGEVWIEGSGGAVQLAGTTEARGEQAGEKGGRVVATGETVSVASAAKVDVSGQAGGGTVHLGGGWQGKDTSIAEAKQVSVAKGAKVAADATVDGDGGTVVAWSGEVTRMNGSVSAKGAGKGKGGQVETSSRGALGVSGSVDVSAPSGKGGNWLLDPNNITITGVTTDTDVDPSNAASPLSYTAGSTLSVYNSSIDEVLTRGASVTLIASGDITINANISKTGGVASTLTFDALGDITLASGINIASTSGAGALHVNFGVTGANSASGTAYISGGVASNGGDVVFHKAAQLISATPVSTKLLSSGSTGTSGAITFHKTVDLNNQASSTVTLDSQSAKSGSTYTGTGGAITFNDQIYSHDVTLPQQLILTTSGAVSSGTNQAGSVTFNNSVGTASNPLGSLSITGPTFTFLNTGAINLKAASGNVLTFGTISSNYIPKLVLGSENTTISVTGISGGTSVDSADYIQSTFDIVTSSGLTAPTLTISSERSIQVVGSSSQSRKITGDYYYYNTASNSVAGNKSLTVNLRPAQFVGSGGSAIHSGSIYLDNALIKSYGSNVSLGDSSHIAYGVASEQNTDGVRLYQSNIYTNGGNLEIWGRAPEMDNQGAVSQVGGLGVYIYGLGTYSTSNSSSNSTGTLTINGAVNTASTSSAKDAVVIGKNGGATVTLQSDNGAIAITGDASGLGTSATAGASYDGISVESSAMIRSVAGNITLTGSGGGGSSSQVGENYGIKLKDSDTQIVSQTGNILLTGLTGGKTSSYGIYSSGDDMALGQERDTTTAKAVVSSRPFTGNIDLVADTMKFTNSSTSRLRMTGARSGSTLTTGQLNIRPYHDITIQIGGTEPSPPSPDSSHLTAPSNPLYLASSLFSGNNAVFIEGFGDITIGRYGVAGSESNKSLTVAGATTVYDPLNLRMFGTTGSNGSIAINAPLTVQSSSGSARALALHVKGGVSGTGTLTTHDLRLIGAGDVALTGSNFVDVLAAGGPGTADGTSYDGNITLSNAQALSIDQVTSNTLGSTATATGIVTANDKNVILSTTSGDISVKQNINAGAGTVSLVASSGAVNETGSATPIITADKLRLYARNSSNLTNTNVINTLAGEISGSGNNLNFKNDDSLVIGAVTVGSSTVNGLTMNAGNVALQLVTGDLTQSQPVVTGSTSTGSFYIRTPGNVILENTGNDFGRFAATLTGGSGTLSVVDKNTLLLGTAGDYDRTTSTPGSFIYGTGIAATGYTSKLWAGANGTGGINEVDSAVISSNNLLLKANDNSTLVNDNVLTGVLSAILTGSNKGLYFTENDAIVIGSVANSSGQTPDPSNGIAGGSSTVVLTAKSGSITQQANTLGDIITSKLLLVASNGSITLQNASNNVGTLAADLATAGSSFSYRDADALTVGSITPISSINSSTLATTSGSAVNGITTSNGSIDLYTLAGSLTVEKSISAGGANSIDLRASGASSDLAINDSATVKSVGGGTIQLAAGRDISTNTATGTGSEIESAGSVLLQAGGSIGSNSNRIELTDTATLAVSSVSHMWLRKLANNDDLTVGTVTALAQGNTVTDSGGSSSATQAVAVGDLNGLTSSSNGNITLTTQGGDLTVAKNITAHGSGTVDIRTANSGNLGDVILSSAQISSSSGNIQVVAGNTLTTNSGNDGVTSDFASSGHLLLEAGLSLGTNGNRLQMGSVSKVAARTLSNGTTSGANSIWLRKLGTTSDLEIGTVSQFNSTAVDNAINGTASNASSLSGLSTTANNGSITLTTQGGDLAITQNVTAHGSGDLDLRSANSGNLGDMVVSNGALLSSSSGTIQLLAGNSISTTSANNSAVPTVQTTGSVLLEAGLLLGDDSNRLQLAQASIVAARTLNNSGSSGIWLRKLGTASDLEVGTVNRVNATALDNAINGPASNAASLSGLTTTANNGAITLTTQGGDLTITQNVSADGSGYVDIRTANTGNLGDIILSGASVSSGSGTIQMIAGNSLTTTRASDGASHDLSTTGDMVLEAGLSMGSDSERIQLGNAARLAARTLSNGTTSGANSIWLRKMGTSSDLEIGTVSRVNSNALDNSLHGGLNDASLSGLTTSANNGNITLSTQGGDLNITQNITAHGSGYVDIRTANSGHLGDIALTGAAISSSSGTIQIIAGNTLTTNSANNGTFNDLSSSGAIMLEAGLRLGAEENRLQIGNAAKLAARTLSNPGSSGIWLRKLGTASDLEIGTVSRVNATVVDNAINGSGSNAASLSGLSTTANNGTITLTTQGGDLTITQNITADGSGFVDIRTASTGHLGDLFFNNDAGVSSGSGMIQLVSGGNITTSSNTGTSNELVTTGNVLLRADGYIGSDSKRIESSGINILAAQSTGVQWLRQASGNLTVGTVTAQNSSSTLDHSIANTAGLQSSNAVIGLTVSAGDLAVNDALNAGTADLSLKVSGSQGLAANITGGVVTLLAGSGASNNIEQGNGQISASKVRFDAGGLVSLSGTPSNLMGTVAGRAGKTLTLADGSNLLIGSVSSTQGSDAVGSSSGLTSDTGDIVLSNSGSLTQAAGALLTVSTASKGLRIQSNGPVTLTENNSVGHLAATVGLANQGFTFTHAGNLVVDQVSGMTGISSNQGAIILKLNSGALTAANNAGISGSSLRLEVPNGVTLSNSNQVQTLAALLSNSGAGIQFTNTGNLLIGTASGLTGITTSSGSILLRSTAGNLSTDSGALLLGDAVKLVASGSVDMRNNNQSNSLAGSAGGDFSYYNRGSLQITSVSGSSGITAGGAIWVRSGGDLTTLQPVVGNGTGNQAVVLSASNGFYNQAGATAVQAPNGRWLIYDDNPTLQDRLGGLNYTFRRVYTWYSDYPPAQVSEGGNGYITTAYIHNPEQYARQAGGTTSSTATGNTSSSAYSVAGSGIVRSVSFVQPAPSLSAPLARPAFAAPGASSAASGGLPLLLPVQSGARFVANLASVVPEGEIAAITLSNGEAVPSWLHVDTKSMRMAGTLPEGAEAVSIRIQVKVAGSTEVRSVDVQLTPAAAPTTGTAEKDI